MLPKVTSGRSRGGPAPLFCQGVKKLKKTHSHDGNVTDINLSN